MIRLRLRAIARALPREARAATVGRVRRSPPIPRSIRRVAIGVAALASALFLVTLGMAADLRVLLIGPSATHATVVRVKQELSLLGIDVEVQVGGASLDLATAAREHDAAAVARVEDAPPEIVLWVDAAHSNGTPQTSRVSESLAGQAEPGLLALRAVELLRGRLLPVPAATPDAGAPSVAVPTATASAAPVASVAVSATAAPSASVSAPPERTAIPRPPAAPGASRGEIHLGPAVLASPGGVPVAPALRLGGGLRVASPVEIDALAILPLTGATVSGTGGQIDLRVLAFGASASVYFLHPDSLLALHAGAGMGVAGLFYEGHAEAPRMATSGSRWTALPYLQAGAGYRFTRLLGVRADVLFGIARPEPVLRVGGESVASFGTPLFLGSLALEVHP